MSNYGFVAVPRKYTGTPADPKPYTVTELAVPDTELARQINEYAKRELPTPVYNHSMRVYHYGVAIQKDQFPHWDLSSEVYFVSSLLHDIGTTDKNMSATKMSFEFWGAIVARDLLIESRAEHVYADAVFEAIARHQDLGDEGEITTLGHLIQLTTILDNVGLHSELIHSDTIKAVNEAFPRFDWQNCFARAVERENREKPWGHTTALGKDQFKKDILGNTLMKDFA